MTLLSIKMYCFFSLCLLIFSNIVTFDIFAGKYSPEPFSYKLQNKIQKIVGKEPPYASLFSSNTKKILYIAALHTSNKTSETFNFINYSIKNFRPDLVIIEGFQTKWGYSPKILINEIQKDNFKKYTEVFHTVYLSHKNNIPFLGGEVDDKIIINELKKDGYNINDVVFFYFSRQIPQYYRQNQINKEIDLVTKWKNYGDHLCKGYNVDFNRYKNWIRKHLGKYDFKLLINSENTAPISNGNFLQKIASKIGIIIDSHIIKLIFEKSKKFNKILVCYGASHFPTQYKALKNKYGVPKFIKHYSEILK